MLIKLTIEWCEMGILHVMATCSELETWERLLLMTMAEQSSSFKMRSSKYQISLGEPFLLLEPLLPLKKGTILSLRFISKFHALMLQKLLISTSKSLIEFISISCNVIRMHISFQWLNHCGMKFLHLGCSLFNAQMFIHLHRLGCGIVARSAGLFGNPEGLWMWWSSHHLGWREKTYCWSCQEGQVNVISYFSFKFIPIRLFKLLFHHVLSRIALHPVMFAQCSSSLSICEE